MALFRRPTTALSMVASLLSVACGSAAGRAAGPPSSPSPAAPAAAHVGALGRVQPRGGIVRLAAPSLYFDAVVGRLEVAVGDRVAAGQVVAVLEHHAVMDAAVEQARAGVLAKEAAVTAREAELENVRLERTRREALFAEGLVTSSERDLWASRLLVAESDLRQAQRGIEAERALLQRSRLERDRALVRSPIDGRVLAVHARAGERVGEPGIAELAAEDVMVVVAEVYEDDIGRVALGQRAVVRSPLLQDALAGSVIRIGRSIGKRDVLGTDPAARSDMKVVEVEVALEDPRPVQALTNLTVDVELQP